MPRRSVPPQPDGSSRQPPLAGDAALAAIHRGARLRCGGPGCGATYSAYGALHPEDYDPSELLELNEDSPACVDCKAQSFYAIVAPPTGRRPVAERLRIAPDDAWGVWLPRRVVAPLFALGALEPGDLAIIASLDAHGIDGAERAAWPSRHTLAEHTGLGVRTVQRRLAALERAGLIEVRQRSLRSADRKPRDTSNGYTCGGLVEALGLIGDNLAAGRDPALGLAELLARLRDRGTKAQEDRLALYQRRREAAKAREREARRAQIVALPTRRRGQAGDGGGGA